MAGENNSGVIIAAIIGGLATIYAASFAVKTEEGRTGGDNMVAAAPTQLVAPQGPTAAPEPEPDLNATAPVDPPPDPAPSDPPANPAPVPDTDNAPPATGSTEPVGTHQIKLENKCALALDIHLYFKGRTGWTGSDGYWTYKPGETSYPTDNDKRLLTDDKDIFLYAKSAGGEKVWRGNYEVVIKGETYQMMKANANEVDDDYLITLTCD